MTASGATEASTTAIDTTASASSSAFKSTSSTASAYRSSVLIGASNCRGFFRLGSGPVLGLLLDVAKLRYVA